MTWDEWKEEHDDWEIWLVAVEANYRMSVSEEEANAKCTPEHLQRVVVYVNGLNVELGLIDDTEDSEEAQTIQLLFDFLAFTEGFVPDAVA